MSSSVMILGKVLEEEAGFPVLTAGGNDQREEIEGREGQFLHLCLQYNACNSRLLHPSRSILDPP